MSGVSGMTIASLRPWIEEGTMARIDYNSTRMSKDEFFEHLHALYRAMNYADSDDERKALWMPHQMAGWAGCGHLDAMLRHLVEIGAIHEDEFQRFHDDM
jgi:hypothetical protein